MLITKIEETASAAFRSRFLVVRTDTYKCLPGEIIEADIDAGHAKMRVRRPDDIDKDGNRKPVYETEIWNMGPGSIALRGR